MPPKTPDPSVVAQRPSGAQPGLSRSERLEMRLSARQKTLIGEAAELSGVSTTQFVVQAAVRQARRVLQEDEMLRISQRDREVLIDALMSPPEPSDTLKAAWKDYETSTR